MAGGGATTRGLRWRVLDQATRWALPLSYGAPGYRMRRRTWDPAALDVDLRGRVMVVTGANAGLGKATSLALAERGATVVMVCRSPERGEAAHADVAAVAKGDAPELELADVSSLAAAERAAEAIAARHEAIDVLVNNAGVMIHERSESVDGVEMTFATNVLGGHVLARRLEDRLAASAHGGRLVHVTSGGMYTQKLDLDDPLWERKPYDGVQAYAQTKRLQVVLNRVWAERLAARGVTSNAMHPGWAATPGVAKSLPRFDKALARVLRDSEQGADTMVWLAASDEARARSGELFLDREAKGEHAFPWTKPKDPGAEAARAWALCEAICQARGPAAPRSLR